MSKYTEDEEQKIIEDFLKKASDGMHPCPPEFEIDLESVESLFAGDEDTED
jgi:hypothetical protein